MNVLLQGLQELLPGTPMLRSLAKFAAMVILFSILLLILFDPYITNPAGKILVIYDSEDNDSPSKQGLIGIREAAKTLGGPEFVPVKLNDQENPYSQLAQSTVNVSILGVISTLTSPKSMPIVRFFRTLRVPLVVAVAANDDLLAPQNGTQGLVFRIVPTNSMQALNIYDWVRTTGELAMKLPPDVPRHIAIFYEGNSFGTFLQQEFLKNLNPQDKEDNNGVTPEIITYNYPVNEHTEFATLLPELRCNHTDLIAYFGYFPRSLELLNKLKSYPPPKTSPKACNDHADGHDHSFVPVLLSDGAYQRELENLDKYQFPFPIWAALPTVPDLKHDLGYKYGYDAYTLVTRIRNSTSNPLSRPALIDILQFHEGAATRHEFTFDRFGELVNVPQNKYKLHLLKSKIESSQGGAQ